MNQHLSVINFLTLGIVVGADELVIAESRSRSNFSASARWEGRDFADLWNATKIASFLAGAVRGAAGCLHARNCKVIAALYTCA